MAKSLPINAKNGDILNALKDNQVIVVVGETGCGKSTGVPALLLRNGFCKRGRIGVTEPRRLAAVSLGTYVAKQHGCEPGELIGYRIRHENRATDETQIVYMTEGMLLRDLLSDPLLRTYDVIVLDEMHERGVFQDLLMALVRRLLPKRPDLTVVVMSATIDEHRFAEYFDAPVIRVDGRQFPVSVEYRPELGSEARGVMDAAIALFERTDGNVLAFVPDYASIKNVLNTCEMHPFEAQGIDVLPLYGNQTPEEQMASLQPARRALIVATNVAETSVTPLGVTGLVDTGLVKETRYYPRTGTSSLKVVPNTQASSNQRTGRAGRLAPGQCIRLFSQDDYASRKRFSIPEIRRTSLSATYLQLRAMGFGHDDIVGFDLMDAPHVSFWDDARETLVLLEALDDDGNELTELGQTMVEMPLSPEISRMVLAALEYGCVRPVVTIASTYSTRPIFLRPLGREQDADAAHGAFRNPTSDFLTQLKAVERWRAAPDRAAYAEKMFLHQQALEDIDKAEEQLLSILEDCGIAVSEGRDKEDIGRAVASGLIGRLLRLDRDGKTYVGRRCRGVVLQLGSSVRDRQLPQYVVTADITETSRLYARNVQVIPTRWLGEVFGLDEYGHRKRSRERHRRVGRRPGKHRGSR